ncbi:MAG: malonyl-CoA decarboxylase family protein [Magnetococcales bacterium]|nr:malonyl-CoA decarboxylase family protein [Magnetococcales bacterium]
MIHSVADKGRDLLNINGSAPSSKELRQLCEELLTGAGEARGTALAREVVRVLESMHGNAWPGFLEMLHEHMGPNPKRVMEAVEAYRKEPGPETLIQLTRSVESPRQELFRRINLSPNGTLQLVRLREHLLRTLKDRPHLKSVDADLQHLFRAWFNRGFLELKHIDWSSPALILEKLVNYESVHAIHGWRDLRRRLERDRRCYAFFHPALPDEPLIFVEVALMRGIPDNAGLLLNRKAEILDPEQADSAIFYSINNCQFGLRGISFGNFLIKQVTTDLKQELPGLKNFATFSPVPGFAETLRRTDDKAPFTPERLRALLADHEDTIREVSGKKDPAEGLRALLDKPEVVRTHLADVLETLALAYLTLVRRGKTVFDPVALFHLSNGAHLERINPLGDCSKERWDASFGVMVNYVYEVDNVERNHEKFVDSGKVNLSKQLQKKSKAIREVWKGG